ncbi:uncharacterized protein LOC108240571 [Kryptolebias marmoratus]|uniref:uncharacterized protein LOC108240571 n=1 Tax=Kryptolebias marmoratus TaxID=37003 RepID=UPI0007F8FDD0|nr:uncharacterized protein LOC108240571 [Kryptolebias marmoratus]
MRGELQSSRQITMTQAVQANSTGAAERIKICEDWVSTCTALNILLSISDYPSMRRFLRDRVVNGGAIPGFHQLQEKYLDAVYQKEKEALKIQFDKKPVAVIFDETPDVDGRCVLNILIAPLEKDDSGRILAYLVDTVFLEDCNHSTVSVAVVQCLHEYSICNENVIVFDIDNAAYMKKAYKASLQTLFPNSIHITCMAHIMNLIGDLFRRPFEQLNSFMLSFSQMFDQAGSRERRYLQFMAKKVPPGKKATLAPNPCATRWNSWFSAVQYHSEHFQLYTEFIEMEINVCGKSAPQSVERLNEMLHQTDVAQKLQVQINIMADKCKVILRLLDIFQSRCPATTKLFNYLEDLQMNFDANKTLQYEACAQYFVDHDLPLGTKREILNTVEQAYNNAEDKLAKYMSHGQPGINFFKEVRVFNPRHIAFMSSTVSSYTAIPGFSAVPQEEMDTYFT